MQSILCLLVGSNIYWTIIDKLLVKQLYHSLYRYYKSNVRRKKFVLPYQTIVLKWSACLFFLSSSRVFAVLPEGCENKVRALQSMVVIAYMCRKDPLTPTREKVTRLHTRRNLSEVPHHMTRNFPLVLSILGSKSSGSNVPTIFPNAM